MSLATDSIVDSRGFFWPSNHVVPDGRFAPPSAVPGRLRIDEGGTTWLDLDVPLASDEPGGAAARLFRQGAVEGAIAGVLAGTDERVLLFDLVDNGGSFRAHGPSPDSYVSYRSLLFSPGTMLDENTRFRWLELDLEGYSEWLGQPRIRANRSSRAISAKYLKSGPISWEAAGRRVELHHFLSGRYSKRMAKLDWSDRALLRIGGGRSSFTAEEAVTLSGQVQDLLILLADSDRGLNFPALRAGRKSPAAKLYYSRGVRRGTPAEWDKAWVPLSSIREGFGSVLGTWLERYDQVGPGFHLYLGNRRGNPMYPEHRFASLVWGLEALHRTLYPADPNPKLEEKVERILTQIERANDRRWAKRFLPLRDEPSLATRIAQLVTELPLDLDLIQVEQFAQRCAGRRNDVSHFGGVRGPGEYDAFLKDVFALNSALDLLYHAILLQQVGVPAELIRRRFIGGLHSYAAAAVLRDVGLTVPGEPPDVGDHAAAEPAP
jgi:ApeA N-terminal domain 1